MCDEHNRQCLFTPSYQPGVWPAAGGKIRLRPAFGRYSEFMLNSHAWAADPNPYTWIGSVPPPDIAHLHRAHRLTAIGGRIGDVLWNPVISLERPNGLTARLSMGQTLVYETRSGRRKVFAWDILSVDRPVLKRLPPERVVLQGMPWDWLWLEHLMTHGMVDYEHALRLEGVPFTEDEFLRYAVWALAAVKRWVLRRNRLFRVRRSTALALKLDPTALRRANSGVLSGYTMGRANVALYNRALGAAEQLDRLEVDAPELLPLYLAASHAADFPTAGEPVQRLKSWLKAQGFTMGAWRFVSRSRRRLLRPIRDHYRVTRSPDQAVLDYLSVLCSWQTGTEPPEWMIRLLFSIWGNPAQRRDAYLPVLGHLAVHGFIVRSAMNETARRGRDAVEAELADIANWAADVQPHLDATQRRRGWNALLNKARRHAAQVREKHEQVYVAWDPPIDEWRHGDTVVTALTDSMQVTDEGLAMRHCAARFIHPCLTEEVFLASVWHRGRHVATAMYEFKPTVMRDGAPPRLGYRLLETAGKANASVPGWLRARLAWIPTESDTESSG